ncbi:MAG: Glycosyltransferase [uncultured Truepera sp.]|uniref:Glycosyltransferase n=1 Tax=uncultured Truepera sp. TaxID=543023 RepID=A0A6J4VC48_9DEIN|nr:MAG: Glycosyltransferase [uncultured Truepera sp.]
MLAPIAWRVPPCHYGPWERVVSLLTEGLVRAGVDVTLFATADSETTATLSAVVPRPYEEDRTLDAKVWEGLHLANVFERAGDFDLIHNHYDFLPLTYSGLVETPVVTTIHGFSSDRILPVYRRFDASTHYVSISDADRHPDLSYAATVPHGIDLGEFTLRETPEDYLLFFGRLHPDKGAAEAIRVAQRTGRQLILAGIVQDSAYFEREVKPHLSEQVQYVGSVGPTERDRLLGGAAALLHLINFDEPFGLSMVEAMACGTPVVATRRGSVPEVIADGVSGFVVHNEDEAVSATDRIAELSRASVRAHVEQHFSQQRMVEDYLRVYEMILAAKRLKV